MLPFFQFTAVDAGGVITCIAPTLRVTVPQIALAAL